MRSSETFSKIAPALVAAINAIEGVKKTAKGNYGAHATLEGVIEAAHEHLVANGLCVMQGPGEMQGNAITVTTRIVHISGEWVETDFSIPSPKLDPQSAGSAVTYARRYSLMAMLNMPAVDDDGQSATDKARAKAPAPAPIQVAERRDMGPGEVDAKDWWGCEGPGKSASQAKKEGMDDQHEQMRSAIDQLHTAQEWREFCANNTADIKLMPKSWRQILRTEAEERGRFLGAIAE